MMIPYLYRESFPKDWARELGNRLHRAVALIDDNTPKKDKMLFCLVSDNYFVDKRPERVFIPPFTYHFYSEYWRQLNDDAGGYTFEFGVYAWLEDEWMLIYHSDKWSDYAEKYFDADSMEILKDSP